MEGLEVLILSQRLRYPLLMVALLSLLAATWAGLLRIGWAWAPGSAFAASHGPKGSPSKLARAPNPERSGAL